MKSIVASAIEFMSAATNAIGTSRKGPPARLRSINSAMPAIVWCPAARLAGVISSETPSSARARRCSGWATAQRVQFDQTCRNCLRSAAFAGSPSSATDAMPAFNSRYNWLNSSALVSKYVNSEPLATPASRAITAVGALKPCVTITRVAALMIALRLSSLLGLAMVDVSGGTRSLFKSV